MTLEYVTSAKDFMRENYETFHNLNLFLYNSSGYSSSQIQSLLIIKINLIAVGMHMGQYTAIIVSLTMSKCLFIYRKLWMHPFNLVYIKYLHWFQFKMCVYFNSNISSWCLSYILEVTHDLSCYSSWTTKCLGHSRRLFSHGCFFPLWNWYMVMGKKCFCTQDVSCHLGNAFAWFQFKPSTCFQIAVEHSNRTLHWDEMCTITKITPSCFVTMVTMPWVYPRNSAWHNVVSYRHLGIF